MRVFYAMSFVILITVSLSSQYWFNKTYEIGRNQAMLSVLYSNDTLFTFGIFSPDTGVLQNCYLALLDTTGNLIKWVPIQDPLNESHLTTTFGVTIFKDENGDIVVPIDPLAPARCTIAKIDADGIVKYFSENNFGSDKTISAYSIVGTYDNGYMITGQAQRSNYRLDVFIIKYSSDGEVQWQKYYGNGNIDEFGFNITRININEYLIGGFSDISSYIFAIDSLGNLKWEWIESDPDVVDSYARGLHRDVNGDYAYFSWNYHQTTYPGEEYNVSVPIFIRRDSLFNLLSYKEIGPYTTRHELHTMIQSRDGGWIGAGTRTNRTDERHPSYWIIVWPCC